VTARAEARRVSLDVHGADWWEDARLSAPGPRVAPHAHAGRSLHLSLSDTPAFGGLHSVRLTAVEAWIPSCCRVSPCGGRAPWPAPASAGACPTSLLAEQSLHQLAGDCSVPSELLCATDRSL